MEIEIKDTDKVDVYFGDVLVGDNGCFYLVTFNTRLEFPVRLIDLKTYDDVNGFQILRDVNCIKSGVDIIRVIKGKNLILKEIS